MTVSLNTAPPAKASSDSTPAATQDKVGKFGQLIDSADAGGPASPPLEAQAAPPAPAADQSLDALLAALKLTLAPGAALLTPTPKKAGEGEKAATAKDKPVKDGDDPAAALLAALGVTPPLAPTGTKSLSSRTLQAVDDVLGKASSLSAALTGLGDAMPSPTPLSLSVDLTTLTDLSAVKPPEMPNPITAQLDRLVDTARDAAWLDRLSQDIAESAGAGDKMRFRMMPPNLGALDVSVERQAGGLSVSMTTHTADARNLIADSRQQMVDSLKAQGVPLVQLSLMAAGEDQAGHRPPTFFNHLIEAAPMSGTDLAAQPVEVTTAERVGRFA